MVRKSVLQSAPALFGLPFPQRWKEIKIRIFQIAAGNDVKPKIWRRTMKKNVQCAPMELYNTVRNVAIQRWWWPQTAVMVCGSSTAELGKSWHERKPSWKQCLGELERSCRKFFWNRICPHLQTMMNVNVFVKQFILRFFLWNRTCTLWIPVYFLVSPLTVRMYTISPSRHHSLRKNRRGFFFFFQFLACDVWCTWSPIKTIFFSSNSSSAAVFSIPKKICSRVRFYQICTRVHQIVICSIWVKTHSAKSPCHWYFMYHGVYSISCPFRFDTVLLDSSFPVSQLNARDITP